MDAQPPYVTGSNSETRYLPTREQWERAQKSEAQLPAMRAALEAVTAQLAAMTEDRNTIERAAKRVIKMHTRPDGTLSAETSIVEAALMDLRAALRGDTAPATE